MLKNPCFFIKKFLISNFSHFHANSLIVYNMQEIFLFEADNIIHKYDFICISETYFDSSIKTDDNSIRINGYELIRTDIT